MSQSRLDLDLLRRFCSRRREEPPNDGSELTLTRRDVLRIGGLSAAALPSALSARPVPAFEVSGDERRLAFTIAGEERWVIDPSKFAGDARLVIHKRTDSEIRFSLRRSRFAGCDLPADFDCAIRRRMGSWRAAMRFAFARGRAEAPFVEWLLGESKLAAPARAVTIASLGSDASLFLADASFFSFEPAWHFRFMTPDSVTFVSARRTINAHQADLSLAASEGRPATSRLALWRGDRSWDFGLDRLGDGHPWRLEAVNDPFDHAVIELTESDAVRSASVVVLPSNERTAFRFSTGGDLSDDQGRPFAMQLIAPALGMSFAGHDTEEALVARFSDEAAPLRMASLALDLHGDGEAGFVLRSKNKRLCELKCEPASGDMAVPVPGAVVATTRIEEPRSRIELLWDSLHCDHKDYWTGVFICGGSKPSQCFLPITTTILRPRDFVNLEFTFRNVQLKVERGTATLCPVKCGKDECLIPLMVVEFPPQSIGEQAFFKTTKATPDPRDPDSSGPETLPEPGKVKSRIAEPSYLVFELLGELPYTLESLLAWELLPERLADNAKPKPGVSFDDVTKAPRVKKPSLVTAIEAPYRMMLSPHEEERWQSKPTRHREGEPHELWHVRLQNRKDIAGPAVRAIWSPDSDKCFQHYSRDCHDQGSSAPFRTTLDRQDRHEIVQLSSDFKLGDLRTGKGWAAGAIPVRHLMLTSLGAWLDLEGHWDPFVVVPRGEHGEIPADVCKKSDYTPPGCGPLDTCPPFTVETWKHIATMGRDHFVRVIYAGFLFPLGHFAVLVKETEREIEHVGLDEKNPPAAYLRQRMYIVVREPDKTYEPADMQHDGRRFPYTRVVVNTLVTPDLDDPSSGNIAPGIRAEQDRFWPRVGGADFLFELTAYDHGNPPKKIAFNAPQIFVTLKFAYDHFTGSQGTITAYEHVDNDNKLGRTRRDLNGQKIAVAKPAKEGDTAVDTSKILFGADLAKEPDCKKLRVAHHPGFEPRMIEAEVRLPAVERIAGPAATPPKITWDDTYVASGFAAAASQPAANHGDVFARLVNSTPMVFPGDKSGGLATPDLNISALSRLAGPVAGTLRSVDNFVKGAFEPLEFFKDLTGALDTKLLGVISLGDVITPVRDLRNQIEKVPRLLMEEVHAFEKEVEGKVNGFIQTIAAALETIEDNGLGLLRASMITICKEGTGVLDTLLNDLQAAILDVFGGVFTQQMEQQPLRYAVPTLCRGTAEGAAVMRTASVSVPARGMFSAADEPTTVVYGAAFVTFRSVAEIMARIEATLQTAAGVTATDIQRIQQSVDLSGPLQAALRAFSSAVQTAASQIASIGSVQIIDAFTRLVDAVKAFATGSVFDKIEKFGDLVTQLQRFVDETLLLARNLADPTTFVKEFVDQLVQSQSLLTTEVAHIATTLETAIHDAQTNFNNAVSALPGPAQSSIASLRAQLDQALTDAATAAVDGLTKPLAEALEPVASVFGHGIDEVMEIFTEVKAAIEGARTSLESLVKEKIEELTRPREIRVNYALHPDLRSIPEGAPVFEATDATDFTISAQLTAKLSIVDPAKPNITFNVNAAIREFKIHLFPFAEFLTLDFDRVTIEAKTGADPVVDVVIRKIIFGEALKFVQTLQDYLPFDKGGNGFFIDVSFSAILVGYRFGIPTIAMGAMTLRGISISAALELPFRNAPARVRFAFADRDKPFILSVGIFGGGGFFAVSLGADKVERLEGSLEFGATAALTVGPASGEAHVFVGIYFNIDPRGARLAGFLDAGGNLDILGLITMSLLFHLAFVHDEATNTAYGEATLHVSFKIGPFFEMSLDLHCRREFSGGGSSQQARLSRAPASLVAGSPQLEADRSLPVLVVHCDQHCGGTLPSRKDLDEYVSPDRSWDTYYCAFVIADRKECSNGAS